MSIYIENNSEYLKQTLIAYIGNKRRLLPFIHTQVSKIIENDDSIKTSLDLFAGSGSVSRLLRTFNLEVHSNDIEYYSYILNYAHNYILPKDEKNMFKHFGGLESMLNILNNLATVAIDDRYISVYYAPKDDINPDIINERMFYTQENGRIIDKVRHSIEDMYINNAINKKEYYYLMARLIYEAATHANTSGVFKAFHFGFGGRNKDALNRIMKPITMTKLPLYGDIRGKSFNMEAGEFLKKNKTSFDIVYIDPPYNQHQYGSNYHLLNTIALWDKPFVNKEIYIDGKKTDKSAIRKDWINTRSDYCHKNRAEQAFKNMVDCVDAKYIIVSYSTDGIINYDNFIDMLENRGQLNIVTKEYTKYPGGKRSTINKTKNIEYLFIVDTNKKSKSKNNIDYKRISTIENIRLLLNMAFKSNSNTITFNHNKEKIEIKLNHRVHVINKKHICSMLENKSHEYINQFINHIKNYIIDEPNYEIEYFILLLDEASRNLDSQSINYYLSNINRLYIRFMQRKSKNILPSINENLLPIINYIKNTGINTSNIKKLEYKIETSRLKSII